MNRKYILVAPLALLLNGCIDGIMNSEDIGLLITESYQKATREVKRDNKIKIPAIPEMVTRDYDAMDLRDPFNIPTKLEMVFVNVPLGGDEPVGPLRPLSKDPTRPDGYVPHPFEGYHLASIKMIGSLGLSSNTPAALVDVGNKKIITVREGDYIGKNFGKVVKITENYVELSEKYGVVGVKDDALNTQSWKSVPAFINLTVKK